MKANYAGLKPADFEEAVAQKLPPRGLAWPRLAGTVFQNFWRVIADALAAVHARASVLTETEGFPPTSVEILPDWERALGLPDPCLGANPVTAARQAAVRAKLAASGGQSIPYYQELAINLGGSITVTEYQGWRWGVDHWWMPWRNEGWAYVWLVTLSQTAMFNFEWGVSAMWEPYWGIANSPIQCEIRRLAPAHTIPIFSAGFGAFLTGDDGTTILTGDDGTIMIGDP